MPRCSSCLSRISARPVRAAEPRRFMFKEEGGVNPVTGSAARLGVGPLRLAVCLESATFLAGAGAVVFFAAARALPFLAVRMLPFEAGRLMCFLAVGRL